MLKSQTTCNWVNKNVVLAVGNSLLHLENEQQMIFKGLFKSNLKEPVSTR